jgi:hypothetical protein
MEPEGGTASRRWHEPQSPLAQMEFSSRCTLIPMSHFPMACTTERLYDADAGRSPVAPITQDCGVEDGAHALENALGSFGFVMPDRFQDGDDFA